MSKQKYLRLILNSSVSTGCAYALTLLVGLPVTTLISAPVQAQEVCSSSASDTDGDGYGWEDTTGDGNPNSCVVPTNNEPECIDSDGDGYGWNGTETCIPENNNPTSGDCPSGLSDDGCMLRVADPGSFNSAGAPREILAVQDFNRDTSGYRTRCLVSHYSYADPLRYQGGSDDNSPSGAHLHMFFGNTSLTGASTSNSLLLNGKSTCGDLGKFNRSSYWIPALFNVDGDVVHPYNITAYYKVLNDGADWGELFDGSTVPAVLQGDGMGASTGQGLTGIPNDLVMISHNSNSSKAVLSRSNEDLTMRIEFLNCIRDDDRGNTGQQTRNTNFQSMASPASKHSNYGMAKHFNGDAGAQRNCQSGYTRIPGVEFNIKWKLSGVGTFNNNLLNNDWKFSNGTKAPEWSQGNNWNFNESHTLEETGHPLHADYMAAWAEDGTLQGSFKSGQLPMVGVVGCNELSKDCKPQSETSNLQTISVSSNFTSDGQPLSVENDNTRDLEPVSGLTPMNMAQ